MRKDHYILWKDENIANKEKSGYLKELSKNLEVNIYSMNNIEDALKIIRIKKHVMFKLITNDTDGKKFIEEARSLIETNFICLVFSNSTKNMEWVSHMENVLLTTDSNDFKKFASLKMNKSDIISFANELKRKYETSEYKFKINENELLHFPDRTFCYLNECNIA